MMCYGNPAKSLEIARARARLMQKRRWRPTFAEVVLKAFIKNRPQIIANLSLNNALFRRLIGE